MLQGIRPNLWFDTQAEEAASFYCSVFENSRIVNTTHYTEAGPREAGMVMTVEFELDGQRFVGINGGPQFTFDEAVSFEIACETQDEVDFFWDKLSEGGKEGPCGWLKDRYGLSWQVVPDGMDELFADSDPAQARHRRAAQRRRRRRGGLTGPARRAAQAFSSRSTRGCGTPARTASSWAANASPRKRATALRKVHSRTPMVPAIGP
jgi:predicted 3-demethylubiquinone-9 3-methyltransferase (glyoxalase superfamily)